MAIVLRGPIFLDWPSATRASPGGVGRSPRRSKTRAEAPAAEDDLEKCAAVVELADVSELHRRGEREHAEHGLREDDAATFAAGKNRGDARVVDDEADEDDEDDEGTRGLLADGSCAGDAEGRFASEDDAFANRTSWVRSLSGIGDASCGASFAAARAPVALAMALTMLPVDARARTTRTSRRGGGVRAVVFPMGDETSRRRRRRRARGAFWSGYLVWILAWWRIVLRRCPPGGMDTRNSILAQALAFVQGITWMRACADELVGLFQAAGRAAGVRGIVARRDRDGVGRLRGGSRGMLALARAGYARMAIAASLAGPVCQLSIGTGFSMLLVRFRGETLRADFADNMRFLALYGVAASVAFAVIVPKLAFALDRRAAFVVMGCYAIAVGVFVALALGEEEH